MKKQSWITKAQPRLEIQSATFKAPQVMSENIHAGMARQPTQDDEPLEMPEWSSSGHECVNQGGDHRGDHGITETIDNTIDDIGDTMSDTAPEQIPKKRTRSPLSKGWMLTLFAPTEEQYKVLQTWNEECEELVVGRETCPETGRLHLHIFVVFKSRVRVPTIQKMLGAQVHCDIVPGKQWSNSRLYIHKPDTEILFDKTVRRTEQGHVMIDVVEKLHQGGNKYEALLAEPSLFYRGGALKLACETASYLRMKERIGQRPKVLWFWGETGTGKSRTAFEMTNHNNICLLSRSRQGSAPWFDGYEPSQHTHVVFDDFRWDWFPFDMILRLTDYVRGDQVEVKGSKIYWTPEVIVFTTCKNIRDTFTSRTGYIEENIDQLIRRVDEEWEFVKFGEGFTVTKIHPASGRRLEE